VFLNILNDGCLDDSEGSVAARTCTAGAIQVWNL
jgi:hypothetical protein